MCIFKKIAIVHFHCGILTPKSWHLWFIYFFRLLGKQRLFLICSTVPAVVISPRCQSVALHTGPSTLRRAACSRCVYGAVCLLPRCSCSTSPCEQHLWSLWGRSWAAGAGLDFKCCCCKDGVEERKTKLCTLGKTEKAASQCCSNRERYWACSDRFVSPGKLILLCKWLPAVPEGYRYLFLSCTMDF